MAMVPVLLLRPVRGHGAEVLVSPFGAILAGVLLLAAGQAVEERGGIAAIRFGAAVRAVASAILIAAVGAAYVTARHVSLDHVEGWTWPIMFTAAAHVVFCTIHDIGTAIDPRFGQPTRLAAFGDDVLRVRSRGGELVIPCSAMRGASIETFRGSWWALLALESRGQVQGPIDALPWEPPGSQSTTVRLTEHQLGMDAATFAVRVNERVERSRAYRV